MGYRISSTGSLLNSWLCPKGLRQETSSRLEKEQQLHLKLSYCYSSSLSQTTVLQKAECSSDAPNSDTHHTPAMPWEFCPLISWTESGTRGSIAGVTPAEIVPIECFFFKNWLCANYEHHVNQMAHSNDPCTLYSGLPKRHCCSLSPRPKSTSTLVKQTPKIVLASLKG